MAIKVRLTPGDRHDREIGTKKEVIFPLREIFAQSNGVYPFRKLDAFRNRVLAALKKYSNLS